MIKRGISPLIATVLLIGFTIVLAALVMKWGGTLFKTQTEETSSEADIEELASKINLQVSNPELINYMELKLLVKNNAEIPINGFIAQIQGTKNTVTISSDTELPAYSSKYVYFNYNSFDNGNITNIKLIPKISIEGTLVNVISASVQTQVAEIQNKIEPTPNTIALWHFNEGSGTTVYDSAGNHDGTIYGATFVQGYSSYGLNLDGIGDYVEIPSSGDLDLVGDLTLDTWVYLRSNPDERGIIVKGTGSGATTPYGLSYGWNERFKIGFGNNIEEHYAISEIHTIEGWYHVVGAIKGDEIRIYVNGNLEGAGTFTGTRVTSSVSVLIGALWGSGSGSFNGILDEVIISNTSYF